MLQGMDLGGDESGSVATLGYPELLKTVNYVNPAQRLVGSARYYKSLRIDGLHYACTMSVTASLSRCVGPIIEPITKERPSCSACCTKGGA